MGELRVSATDFRVHLKDWANQVAGGGDVVFMERHGFVMGVLISAEEYEEFRRFRDQRRKGAGGVEVPSEHPDELPVEEVVRIYQATTKATDERTLRWRGKAYISLRARTGQFPGDPPS